MLYTMEVNPYRPSRNQGVSRSKGTQGRGAGRAHTSASPEDAEEIRFSAAASAIGDHIAAIKVMPEVRAEVVVHFQSILAAGDYPPSGHVENLSAALTHAFARDAGC